MHKVSSLEFQNKDRFKLIMYLKNIALLRLLITIVVMGGLGWRSRIRYASLCIKAPSTRSTF
jgi:hypothetical protein